jgi:hypothetical protein
MRRESIRAPTGTDFAWEWRDREETMISTRARFGKQAVRIWLPLGLIFGLLWVDGRIAEAALKLELTSGMTSITIQDETLSDLCSGFGCVSFSGMVGSFIVNVTTGLSKPVLTDPLFAEMDLNSINVSSSSGGALTIRLTDTDFPQTFFNGGSLLTIGGVTGGTVTYSAYLDNNNSEFGTAVWLGTLGPYSYGEFSGSTGIFGISGDGSFSLTQVVQITHTNGATTSFNAVVRVAQPATLVLVGAALIGVSLILTRASNRGVQRSAS